jgi:hypothetical protein
MYAGICHIFLVADDGAGYASAWLGWPLSEPKRNSLRFSDTCQRACARYLGAALERRLRRHIGGGDHQQRA